MTEIAQRKRNLRDFMRTQLKTLSDAQRASAGAKVRSHVEAWLCKNLQRPISVAYFASISDEIDTSALDDLFLKIGTLRAIPHITLNNDLEFIELLKDKPASLSVYRASFIPKENLVLRPLALERLDLVFVPGLAFDKCGHRLGRGKGYYDRALSQLKSLNKRPILIGLAMDEQVLEEIPREEHDVLMDYLCTPTLGMFRTNREKL